MESEIDLNLPEYNGSLKERGDLSKEKRIKGRGLSRVYLGECFQKRNLCWV